LLLRRVQGKSMLPSLKPGQLVFAMHKDPKEGEVVIAKLLGREIIKRVKSISQDGLYLVGDNSEGSSDSRDYGAIKKEDIVAVVVWPRV